MFYTYLLSSLHFSRTYVGQTDDVESRLKTHNAGKVRSTKAYRPWELVYFEEYQTRGEAMVREEWFKSQVGRKRIAELLAEKRTNAQVCPTQTEGRGRDLVALKAPRTKPA